MAAPQDVSRASYSNLEVIQYQDLPSVLDQDNGIEVVNHYHNDKQAVWAETDPSSPPIAHPAYQDNKILNPYGHAPEVVHAGKHQPLPRPPATIWGIRRKILWIILGVVGFITVACAIGGGVGGYYASKSTQTPSESASSGATGTGTGTGAGSPNPSKIPIQNLSIAALYWVDGNDVRQYRLFHQPASLEQQPHILESAWSSQDKKWTVSNITDTAVDVVKQGTPIAASAGHPHTNTSINLVRTCASHILITVLYNKFRVTMLTQGAHR